MAETPKDPTLKDPTLKDARPLPRTKPRFSATYTPDVMSEIRRAAATGIYDIRGAGAKRQLPHFDDLLFLGASISRYPLEGYRERCGTEVTKRTLNQWYFRITEYADALLDDMDQLTGHWPERVLAMQRNWIGRSEGLEVRFSDLRITAPLGKDLHDLS